MEAWEVTDSPNMNRSEASREQNMDYSIGLCFNCWQTPWIGQNNLTFKTATYFSERRIWGQGKLIFTMQDVYSNPFGQSLNREGWEV